VAGNLTLEGMDEILDRLKELGQRAAPVENQALYAGAKVVQEKASQKAPPSAAYLFDKMTVTNALVKKFPLSQVNNPKPPTGTPLSYLEKRLCLLKH
jgi:hypothetical protein